MRSILVQDFSVPDNAIRSGIQETPPGLSLRVDRDWLPAHLSKTLDDVMAELCKSVRNVLDAKLPSLSHGLGMRYVPQAGLVEIGVGPDTQPIYPRIITATVKELRITKAGERHLRERNKHGAL